MPKVCFYSIILKQTQNDTSVAYERTLWRCNGNGVLIILMPSAVAQIWHNDMQPKQLNGPNAEMEANVEQTRNLTIEKVENDSLDR